MYRRHPGSSATNGDGGGDPEQGDDRDARLDARHRIAEQRLVAAERSISRLHLLREKRRSFDLDTADVEALIRRFEARIEIWNRQRDQSWGRKAERQPVGAPEAEAGHAVDTGS